MPFKRGPEQSKQSREAQKASAKVSRKDKDPKAAASEVEPRRLVRRNQQDKTS